MRNIVVCTKVVPKSDDVVFDTKTMTLSREGVENQINETDKNAIEFALRLREKSGGRVILISMGPPFFQSHLKIGIAMGADDAVLLSAREFAGGDSLATAAVLAAGIRKIGDVDLVVLGEESSDGGTGSVPSQVAELLDLPQILFVSDLSADGNKISARKTIKGGHQVVESEMPAVISLGSGINQPRFPDFKKKKWAETEFNVKVLGLADLDIKQEEAGLPGSYTKVVRLAEASSPERRREILTGTDEQLAKRIAEILREN